MTDAPAPAAATGDPLVSACVRLGWQMEELFSRLDVPDGPQTAYQLDRLIGLSKLTSYDQQRLGLDEVDFVLDQVAAQAQAPNAAVASLTADARGKLDATLQSDSGARQRRDEYLESLAGLHVDVLTTLTAAGGSYGKAYGLGRALADTARPHQDPDELTASFQRYRIGQLYVWLDELASLLPAHSAHAVEQSLTWWQAGGHGGCRGQHAQRGLPARDVSRQPRGLTLEARNRGTDAGQQDRPAGRRAAAFASLLAAAVARQGNAMAARARRREAVH